MGKRVKFTITARRLIGSDKIMGEVRVKVKLTNATDDALARRGKLKSSKIRSCIVDAVVDTGAVRTVLPSDVVQKLGLQIRKKRVAEYADGRKEEVGVTEPLIVECEGRETAEDALVLGDEVLLGQTFLESTDLFVDCGGQRLVPNPAHPDQAVIKIK